MNQVNTNLLERASEMIDYFEGKIPAELIAIDIDNNDLDSLHMHVTQAEAMAAQQEFENNDVY